MLVDEFLDAFGRPPVRVWSAPGRVNLIGEHTDYNGGLVLPFAIDLRTTAAIRPRDDRFLRVRSCQQPDQPLDVPLHDLAAPPLSGWAAYVAGVFGVLILRGYDITGADVMVDGQVPPGAGLSSSAALECAVAAAAVDLFGLPLAPLDVAAIAQEAENRFVGVPCGPMDQQIAMQAEPGCALLIDCSSGHTRHVPFTPERSRLAVLVVDTGVRHAHADSDYAARRRACERAAAELGVSLLSEVTVPDLTALPGRLDDDELGGVVRHVVTENARVRAAVAALDADDAPALGPLLTASHVSTRRLLRQQRGAGPSRRRPARRGSTRRAHDRRWIRR